MAMEEAIRDGYLVDYEAVAVHSDVRINGIFLEEGERVGEIDPETGLERLDHLEDERFFEASQVEHAITSPDSNRKILEEKLRGYHVRIYKDIHVSGHACKEDLREFLMILKPKILCPSHGGRAMMAAFAELAKELPFKNEVKSITNGEKLRI